MHKYLILFSSFLLFSCERQVDEVPAQIQKKCKISVGDYFQNGVLAYNEYFEYDENKNVSKISEISADKKFKFERIFKNEYDSENNLIKVSKSKDFGGNSQIEFYTYYPKSIVKSKKIEYSSNYYELYEYNELGSEILFKTNKDGMLEKKSKYSDKNLLLEETIYTNKGIQKSTVNTYNIDNAIVKSVVLNNGISTITDFVYDDKKQLVKTSDNQGKETNFTYSNLKKEQVTTLKAKFLEGYKYDLDEKGNVLKIYKSVNGKDYILTNEISYFPNSKKKSTSEYRLKMNSNTQTYLYMQLDFIETGNMEGLKVFSENNQLTNQIKNTFECN